MAYATLATQSAGQTASAAGWANVVKENFEAIGPHIKLRKTADQSVTSSVALVDDTHLTFAIAANETWMLDFVLHVNTGAGGIQLQITGPSGSSGISQLFYEPPASAVDGAHSLINAVTLSSATSFTNAPFWVKGIVVNGATPGNARLQWAQSSSSGTASTIKLNSFLIAHRI